MNIRLPVHRLSSWCVLSFCLFSLMSSCKDSATMTLEPEQLIGEWRILEAYRGNSKTRLLDNGVFKFTSNQGFQTNILQDTNLYKYILNEQILFIEDSARSRYRVIGLSQDTLTLMSSIHNFDFKFVLLKTESDETN